MYKARRTDKQIYRLTDRRTDKEIDTYTQTDINRHGHKRGEDGQRTSKSERKRMERMKERSTL